MESVKKWLSERAVKRNGIYVHYSPPKALGGVSGAQLRQWARGGSEGRLERAVLAGQGRRLMSEAEALPLARHLPALMAKCSALHTAVERGSLLELQELLGSEYNKRKYVMCTDEAGVGLLHKAIYYDYMDIAEWLVRQYPQAVHQKDSEGRTPLHYAAVCRDEAGAAALLEGAGAARGARDSAGRTPAYYRGPARSQLALPTTTPVEMVRDKTNATGLVIKRHNIRIWCHDCDMARLQRVVWEGHGTRLLSEVCNQPVVKKFLEAVPYIMNTIREIHQSVIRNDIEGVMKHTGDPVPPIALSSRDANNMTVFHKAAGLGHVAVLKYIAERYPQGVNDIDNDGRSPLHYAATVRDEQHTYKTLVSLGADESVVDNKNKTPGYYINRPQEIDRNILKTIPDAPRTASSAYPSSWDWKLLDTEVIAELNKKSRRKNFKVSTENISSNNTTSENTENIIEAMKTSSTQELIKDLPDLDDSSKSTKILSGVKNKSNNVFDKKDFDEVVEQEEESHQENDQENNNFSVNKEDENENNVDLNNKDDIKEEEEKGDDNTNESKENEEIKIDEDNESKGNFESEPLKASEDTEQDNSNDNDEDNQEITKKATNDNDNFANESEEVVKKDKDESVEENNDQNLEEKDNDDQTEEDKTQEDDQIEETDINKSESANQDIKDNPEDEEQQDNAGETPAEGNDNKSETEDDDDVQVQGESQSEYSDFNLKSTAEASDTRSATRGNLTNGRNTQESLIEGIVNGDLEMDSQDASISQRNGSVHGDLLIVDNEIDPEVTDLINTVNMEMLAALVLNGEGARLIGRHSTNAELQSFLENVPTYMKKIHKVHLAAREGNIRDLQAALDRRKFAIARDPISANGATPLHVATIFGKTNIMKYLGGRFPETLSAVDFEGRTALHYAAVLPDNGHYYNLLQQLGANSKDLDDNGRTAEDYYRNHSLMSLEELLTDFGINEDALQDMLSDKGTNPNTNGHMDIPIFRTEEGRYLAKSLGDPLIKGLTEVANVKPKDPIAFLASFLHNFPDHEKPRIGTQESNMVVTREAPEVENEQAPTHIPTTIPPQTTFKKPERPIEVITVDPKSEPSPDGPEAAFSSVNRDEHGQSMLHFAAARTHTRNALFQLLQESDINLAYRDELYRTARDVSIQANVPDNTTEIDRWVLHLAARGNSEKIMELLLEGYDHILDVLDEEGVPISEVISQRGLTEMSNLLDSIPAFEESRESLQSAIRRGDLSAVEIALSAEGGRTLARGKNSFGRTALHVAILAQHEEIVAHLADTCPDLLRIGDNLERTPLHYAMGVDKMESLSRVLIRAGAKRVLKDLKGRQPSYYFMNKSDILRLKEEEEVY